MSSNTQQQNDIGSDCNTNKETTCIVCGQSGFECQRLVLRQPLTGGGYGRISETGSVCAECVDQICSNARGGGSE